MTSSLFSLLFVALLALSLAVQLWLNARQIRHVGAHRDAVPAAFRERISLAEHQKAADYSIAKARLARYEILVDALLLLALTQGGVLNAIDNALRAHAGDGLGYGVLLFAASSLLAGLVGLPFSLYRSFVLEARFGFNRLTWRLWLIDAGKSLLLALLLGAPLLVGVLWLMQGMGPNWWLTVWLAWLGFNLLMLAIYPRFIAPLFNQFTPLDDAALRTRIDGLLARCGFASSGLFVMDGSRRSAHGNAYFTGLGKSKRIVFFDTLLSRLDPMQIESVLAHELGHFHHRHVLKRFAVLTLASLLLLRLLAWLMQQPWFYSGLGVDHAGTAMALLLLSLALPVCLFPLTPLLCALSRRDEFQADRYAVQHASAPHLVSALVALYRDNAATLTPDPLHSLFHDSHPPASVRIAHIAGAGQ